MAWATTAEAHMFWLDSQNIDDAVLEFYLDSASEQCAAYAPAGTDPTTSTRYVLACIYQAREIYSASQRGEQDVIGVGDYAIRARPLTAAVKQLLRPQTGAPVVG